MHESETLEFKDPVAERVYIFLDESGNLDFGPKGTRYFVLTAVRMLRPFPAFTALMEYKYDCLENGVDTEHFHCYDDSRIVRKSVFDLIGAHLDGMLIDCGVVEKAGVSQNMRADTRFYPAMLGYLLDKLFRRELAVDNARQIIVITDTIPVKRKHRAMEKAIRTTLSGMLPSVKYTVLHHQSRSHYGLQIADYCCWAIFRRYERGDDSWYDRIKPAIRNELVIDNVV